MSDLKKDLEISDLNEDCKTQPGKYAYYAEMAAEAGAVHSELKLKLSILEADLDKEIREKALQGGPKITEKAIEQGIVSNPVWQKLSHDIITAKKHMDYMSSARDAMEQRKDMLVSLTYMATESMKSTITVKG